MEQILTKIVDRLKAHYQPEKIILFGSLSRGKPLEELEDIDILVITRTDKFPIERIREAADILEDLEEDIDIFIYTPEEYESMKQSHHPFIESIERSHKVLYQKNVAA